MTSYNTISALLEAIDKSDPKTIADWMEANCEPWLSEMTTLRAMYRGTDRSLRLDDGWDITYVRSDRKPLGWTASMDWDKLLMRAGKTALRANSIFVTGSDMDASDFGQVYSVVPIGPFNYTWIVGIDDANVWYDRMVYMYLEQGAPAHEIRQRIYDHIHTDLITNVRGDDRSLHEALATGHEIMIRPHSGRVALFDTNLFRKVMRELQDRGWE